MPAMKTKYGHTFIYGDKTFIQFFPVRVSLEKTLHDKYEKWSTKRTYDDIHEICNFALMLGDVDDAVKYCDEYAKMPSLSDKPKPAQFDRFFAAYKGLIENMGKPLPANGAAEEWKNRFGSGHVETGPHFSLIYFDTNQKANAQRRLKVIENNFKAFYLWHALQGLALQLPEKKLIAVLCDSTEKLKNFHDSLDALPIVSDACFSPSHNLLLIAPERMDPNGNSFLNLTRARWNSGWNPDELIRGVMPVVQPGNAAEAAQMSMLAIAERFNTEEADNAAISREGCRQLLSATGLLPPHVKLPSWLENGLGFYFQRAKGPLFLVKNDGFKMAVGLATGYGTPNFEQHRAFDSVKADFARVPATTLANVLTGAYYYGAATLRDVDPQPRQAGEPGQPTVTQAPAESNDPPQVAQAKLRLKLKRKADASAWALTYYLQKTRIDGLKRFYQELGRMPRDMRLDSEEIMKIFCISFGLVTADQQIDGDALKSFADNWLQYMNNVPHYDYEVSLDASTMDPISGGQAGTVGSGAQPGGNQPGGNTPGGGGPGGRPGPGGGGPGGRPGGPGG